MTGRRESTELYSKNRQVKSQSADLNLIRETWEEDLKPLERAESSNKASAGKNPQPAFQAVGTVWGQKNEQNK